MKRLHAPAPRHGRLPALTVAALGFIASALSAATLNASLSTWIAGCLGLWILTGSLMTALWPAPELTREQVAATRGEERVVWPAVKARLVPTFSPWLVGLGTLLGLKAAELGWGGGNLPMADSDGANTVRVELAVLILLAPLGVMLANSVTFPALYAAHHTGAERLWGFARATGFAGVLGCILCCSLGPDSTDGADAEWGGRRNLGATVRYVGHLFAGDSGSRPGWLVPMLYLSVTLAVLGLWLLFLSDRTESDEDRADDESA